MFTEWNPWILTDRILYKAGLDIWDFLILIAGTAIVGWVSRVGNKIDLHRNFVSQSWLYRAVIILAMLGYGICSVYTARNAIRLILYILIFDYK